MVPRVVCISASTGQGLQDLVREVEDITGVCRLNGGEPVLATERQRDAVRLALDRDRAGVRRIGGRPNAGRGFGMCGQRPRRTHGVTGERMTEAVVEDIFSRFCVGK